MVGFRENVKTSNFKICLKRAVGALNQQKLLV